MTCDAWTGGPYPSAHSCDDPVICALSQLGPPEPDEADQLHALLDRIEEACEGSKVKVAESILTLIHTQRGGPR